MLSTSKRVAVALSFASVLAWSEGAHAAVGEPDTVTCAYPVWVGFGPVHLANELGYFKEEGITVEEILDDDMPNAVAAMERGDIDCYLRTVGEYQGYRYRPRTDSCNARLRRPPRSSPRRPAGAEGAANRCPRSRGLRSARPSPREMSAG
jgi:hypothetical protein